MSYADVQAAVDVVRARFPGLSPRVGVVLGSGLGAFAQGQGGLAIPYGDIPGFPPVGVVGHGGRLVVTERAAILAGRAHYYEGHDLARVVLPVRALVALGCGTIVLTNAAGGIDRALGPGDLVLLRDHVNLLGDNPLRGAHEPRFGPRFPDMSEVYDAGLRAMAAATAADLGVALREGIYACVPGPSYETPAEIDMLSRLGADVVGMSTVPEAIAAHAMGARIVGISCVTNLAAGRGAGRLTHADVTENAARAQPRLVALLAALVEKLST
ncbi:MAG: purine-nucleoside phosphorylase [Myxococcota bacterium]